MRRFLRRGGAPGTPARRWLAVLSAVGAVIALGAVTVDAFALTAEHHAAQAGVPHGGTARAVPATGSTPGTPRPKAATSHRASNNAATTSSFRQIILPDLLIVAPRGLTPGQLARLRAVAGVRNMISFDGAQITAGGARVNVIGVDPTTFRSWVPLQTASDQNFWSDLARGDFVAGTAASGSLGLIPGDPYRLAGASVQVVKFGMAAPLELSGVDLLVNPVLSARLGLVRQVAGLISAPGVNITTLQAEVAQILGPDGRAVVLRSQQLPVAAVPSGSLPASYLQLFKASAAQFCPGLSWTILAAIGQIESGDGQNMGPSSAGALGPMQFLPSTWSTWGITAFGQTGPPDVMNPFDAVPSAARLLCADGAAAGGTALSHAIFEYNHSDAYVREVLSLAAEYAADYA
jgi:hypothetical protein